MAKAETQSKRTLEELVGESVALLRENQRILKEMDEKLRKIVVAMSYR